MLILTHVVINENIHFRLNDIQTKYLKLYDIRFLQKKHRKKGLVTLFLDYVKLHPDIAALF